MKKYFQRVRETLNEVDETIGELVKADFERRVDGLKKAVEDGWFKHYLMGTGIVGAGLIYTGLTKDNDYVTGFGKGLLAMTGLYTLLVYGKPYERLYTPILRKLKKKKSQEKITQE